MQTRGQVLARLAILGCLACAVLYLGNRRVCFARFARSFPLHNLCSLRPKHVPSTLKGAVVVRNPRSSWQHKTLVPHTDVSCCNGACSKPKMYGRDEMISIFKETKAGEVEAGKRGAAEDASQNKAHEHGS